MKKIVLLVFALLTVGVNDSFSQVIKLEHGLNFTWMKGDDLYEKRPTYSVMLGCDYFEHDWFYLSSEIGYIKKGGEDTVYDYSVLQEGEWSRYGYARRTARLNYLHVNTSFRVKHSFDKVTLYVGVAPTLDFLMRDNCDTRFDYRRYKDEYNSKKVVLGIKPEIGAYYNVDEKLRVMFNLSFMRNITSVGEIKNNSLDNHTVALSLGIGYKL